MKVAVLSGLRRKAGDLSEFFLLRAIHAAASYLNAEAMVVCGPLCASATEKLDFAETVSASVKRRKLAIRLIWMKGEGDPADYYDHFPEPVGETLDGLPVPAFLALLGEVPEMFAPEFPFVTVELNGGRMENRTVHSLAVPSEWRGRLTDYHVHTNLAYCSENMTVPSALRLAKMAGVGRLNFAEHSGQLYFGNDDYWAGRYVMRTRGTPEGVPVQLRLPLYRDLIARYYDGSFSYGFEVDADPEGVPAITPDAVAFARIRVGSIHHLFCAETPAALKEEFLRKVEALLQSGVRILAHPFRIFTKGFGMAEPEELYLPTIELLKRYGAAAEINCHAGYRPNPAFFALCLKHGVKLSIGTDSHNLYEVGFLTPHFAILKAIDAYSRLDEVLI
ncbi:MAG: hypothetical protein V8T90_12140 [Victivallales bacterium]